MKKVLLINPTLTREELYARGSTETASILPPLGLAYIASLLERDNYKVRIIDGIVEDISLEELKEISKEFDYIGITSVSMLAKRVYDIIGLLKDLKIPVIVGGPHATAVPEDVINKGADYVVQGEGEITMLELLNALDQHKRLDRVRGIYYKKDNKIRFTGPRSLIENLDMIPFPARHLLPMNKYKNSEARTNKQPSHSIITSRGCPFNCTFCNKKLFGRKFRAHSPERVVEEMVHLIEKYGARDIAMYDDNFTVDKKRVEKICELILSRKLNISWTCEARVDCVDSELLLKMKKAGCEYIAYGIESGSARVLRSIRKNFDKDKVREVFKLTKEAGIGIRAYFILGLVTDTIESMKETIEFAKEIDGDITTFTFWTPLPGTDDYKEALTRGYFPDPKFWEKKNIPEFHFLENPIYLPDGVSAEQMMELHKMAYRKFYLRPKYLFRKLCGIRSKDDIIQLYKGFKTLSKL